MNEYYSILPSADMKLPNGYGTIRKEKGRRRYPYAVYAPDGKCRTKDGKLKTKYKRIGSTSTREEGIILLNRYHHVNDKTLFLLPTFADIYHMWKEEYFSNQEKPVIVDYRAAFKTAEMLHGKIFIYLKTSDLQYVIDHCGKNYTTLRKLTSLFRHLYRYAMSNDLCDKNYASYINIKKHKKIVYVNEEDKVFSSEAISILWEYRENPYYQMILILIYTGVRIGELLSLRKENLNLEEQYFIIVNSKTQSGFRKVPIADKIVPFFKEWNKKSEIDFVFTTIDNSPLVYSNYRDTYFDPIMQYHGFHYTPHCCRHTFVSLMMKSNINPTIIKQIVGHKRVMSITESVYTHFTNKELIEQVNKIIK